MIVYLGLDLEGKVVDIKNTPPTGAVTFSAEDITDIMRQGNAVEVSYEDEKGEIRTRTETITELPMWMTVDAPEKRVKAFYIMKEFVKFNGEIYFENGYLEKLNEFKESEYEKRTAQLVERRYTVAKEISFIYKPDTDPAKTEYRNYVAQCKAEAKSSVELDFSITI